MALSSMTGFARASGNWEAPGVALSWAWDVKSVNGKAFDLRLRMPPGYDHLEVQARTMLVQSFKRGNFQASLNVETAGESSAVRINQQVLGQIVVEAERLREKLGGAPPQPEALLAMRGVLEQATTSLTEEQAQARDEAILDSLAAAAKDLTKSRRDEGARLRLVLEAQLKTVSQLVAAAQQHPSRTVERVKERLKEQVAKLMEASQSFDQDRLHQEAVMLATRNDIAEEIDRLHSHIEAATQLIKSNDPVGRKFDFLAQEFNREANTLCSKANDKGLTAIGLDLKTVIDQLREQVQNIE